MKVADEPIETEAVEPPPAPPFPNCGHDPTYDTLGCYSYEVVEEKDPVNEESCCKYQIETELSEAELMMNEVCTTKNYMESR
ncbi:MAG: hypothetical protein HN891_08140 [Planctomycetes bacterium]|jgi:hypothetical protein|nr:hypothetical protein [Planctomycetota bacterium]